MKWHLNLAIIVLVIVLLGFLGFSYFAESDISIIAEEEDDLKIAYVDMQRIYNSHPAKEEAERELSETARQIEAQLNQDLEDLPGEEQQNLLEEYQADLTEKEQQLMEEILININQKINIVAAEKKFDIVLEKEDVVYGGYNLTDEVINHIEENVNIEEDLDIDF